MSFYWRIRYRFQLMGLSPVTRAVVRDRLTYLSVEKLKRIERAAKETEGVAGDILEFGVALGGSGIILAHSAAPPKRFAGFDVFAMIPPPTSEKDDQKSKDRFAASSSSTITTIMAAPTRRSTNFWRTGPTSRWRAAPIPS